MAHGASEHEAVLEHVGVDEVAGRAYSFDLGHDAGKLVAGQSSSNCRDEVVGVARAHGVLDAGSAGAGCQVSAGRRGGGKPTDGEEALIVEDDLHQVAGAVAGEGRQSAEVHQDGPVAVQHDNAARRLAEGEAEPYRGGEAHGVSEVEEVRPVAERVQLSRGRAHDGDHGAVPDVFVNRLQALQACHASLPPGRSPAPRVAVKPAAWGGSAGGGGGSSHISERVISSATGEREDCARVIARSTLTATSSGFRSSSCTMPRASRTRRV